MQNRQPLTGSCSSISLPATTRFAEESKSLREKLARQVEWMQRRGISIGLKETERPSAEQKDALPGTVLYFADET